jgi:hypothetical protein
MISREVTSDAQDNEHQATRLLAGKFRRLAVWVGILAWIAALLRFLPIWADNFGDIVTGLFGFLLGGLVGLFFWAITCGIGALTCDYRRGTRFQKAWILAALFGGLACFIMTMYTLTVLSRLDSVAMLFPSGGAAFAVVALLMGVMACVFVLAVGAVVDWVLEGFRRGMGFRRLTVPVAVLSALVIDGFIFGAGSATVLAIQAAFMWLLCGIRRDLEWRTLAYRVGWFAAMMVLLIALESFDHVKGHASLRDGHFLIFVVAMVTGGVAWAVTLIVGKVRGRSDNGEA